MASNKRVAGLDRAFRCAITEAERVLECDGGRGLQSLASAVTPTQDDFVEALFRALDHEFDTFGLSYLLDTTTLSEIREEIAAKMPDVDFNWLYFTLYQRHLRPKFILRIDEVD